MKGEVINRFRDKFHFNILYEVGAIVDFDEERMNDLFARKLCKKIEEQDKKPVSQKGGKEKQVLGSPKEDEEPKGNELDEKTKSEQEAAEKIAKVTAKLKKD